MAKAGMQGRAAGSSLTAMYNQRPVDAPDVRCLSHLVKGHVEMVSLQCLYKSDEEIIWERRGTRGCIMHWYDE